ncbi:protein-glutamine glutaminase family protein [Bacteriovoracaceae bacterium]|nr:protein-glutamine glutaminase family protein [Bacteriovoracaceae bacterium]
MTKFLVSLLAVLQFSYATDYPLPSFNSTLEDISEKGITSEEIFNQLDRSFIKLSSSICANRAMLWLWQMQREMKVQGAKAFIFYTPKKNGTTGSKNWWYHVTPVVNENGNLIAVDRGFSRKIKSAVPLETWFEKFAGNKVCREIKPDDHDLIKRMFVRRTFPINYKGEENDCYYIVAPAGYWIPSSVAMHLLGKDSKGEPVHFVRDEMRVGEVKKSCREAVNKKVGKWLGLGRKKCKKLIGKEYY